MISARFQKADRPTAAALGCAFVRETIRLTLPAGSMKNLFHMLNKMTGHLWPS